MDSAIRLLAEIESEVRATSTRLGKDKLDPRVAEALLRVPRHEFVAPDLVDSAYINAPLPIGYGQTISQPYVVAVMTDLLALEATDKVLEIGTGCGYQTAILAELVEQVFSIEVVSELAVEARQRLDRLGYKKVQLKTGDGRDGWPEYAPFDAIVVTAAGRRIPIAVTEQLAPGGRMMIPVGGRLSGQNLTLVEKDEAGNIEQRVILPVAFVPLVKGRARR